MKARAFGLIFLLLFIGIAILAQTKHLMNEFASTEDAEVSDRQKVVAYGRLPLSFEANQGQTDEQVKFLSRGKGYTLFLTSTEAVLSLNSRQNAPRAQRDISTSYSAALASSAVSSPKQRSAVLRMKLVGANPEAEVVGREELPGKSNYFIGNDPKQWRTNVPHYAKVKYEDVYPGIDLVYYGTNQRQLEYDFVVAPGADPRAIRLGFEGAETVEVDAAGHLVVELPDGEVRFQKPRIYQPAEGGTGRGLGRRSPVGRRWVAGRFVLRDNREISFDVGPYDAAQPLIIDPVLVYSTYLGGSGDDVGRGIGVDSAGNAYLTGFTTSANFPTASPLQAGFGGGNRDAFVTKLNPTGSALLYSTYLGGSGDDLARGIAVDSAGNAYLTGFTASTNFPTASPLQAGFAGGVRDAFVAKLNPTGSALLYSTYLGGSSNDEGDGITVDSAGNAYLTGSTSSTNFPTVSPLQASFGGGLYDAFVAKLNPAGSAMFYSTYLGGSGDDGRSDIAVDSAGNAYLTGYTDSTDFPTASPLQAGLGGAWDAFVAKLNPAGSALLYSTYLGGSSYDDGRDIAVDSAGNVYLTGETWSTDYPTVNALQAGFGGGQRDAFVAKLNSAGSAFLYSTYLGGSGNDEGWGIAVDSAGNAYLTGNTFSTNFPTASPLQASSGGSEDAFVTKLNPTGSALVYSTYLGGSGGEGGSDIAVDSAGNAYLTGETASTNFSTTTGTFQTALAGGSDAFVTKIVALPNDNFADATVITTTPYSNTVDTSSATTETTDPTPACGNGSRGKSVWYRFTPPTSGTVTADTFGSNYDTILSVWTGSPGAFSAEACNDDAGATLQSQVSFTATAGTAYFFMISAYWDDGGTLVFNLVAGNPVPSLTFLSPSSATAGGTDFTLTATGLDFVDGAVVRWGGSDRPTTFVSSTELQAAISASDIANGDLVPVDVGNPPPGSGTSNRILFPIADIRLDASPASPGSDTVSAGQAATYIVTVTPQFGSFDATVTLSCSAGLPPLSSCSFSPATLTPGGSDATSTLTVSTTAPSAFLTPPFGPRDDAPFYALWLGLPGLVVVGLTLVGQKPKKVKLGFYLSLSLLLALFVLQVACGGDGGTTPSPPPPRPGTPAGTFNITITGRSGWLVRSTTASLTVQ